MKKFEYLIDSIHVDIVTKTANKLGQEGWELIQYIMKSEYTRLFVFKREIINNENK